MAKQADIVYRKLPESLTFDKCKHDRIEILNFPIPEGCRVYLNRGIRPIESVFHGRILRAPYSTACFKESPSFPRTLPKRKFNCAIFLYTQDANIKTLLIALGHYLLRNFSNDYFIPNPRGYGIEFQMTEEQAGAHYYKKVTGKTISLKVRKQKETNVVPIYKYGKPSIVEEKP